MVFNFCPQKILIKISTFQGFKFNKKIFRKVWIKILSGISHPKTLYPKILCPKISSKNFRDDKMEISFSIYISDQQVLLLRIHVL